MRHDPRAHPRAEPPPVETAVPLDGAGLTVQVLDGRWDEVAYLEAIEVLEGYGYAVTASGAAGRRYPETTIFWTEGQEANARTLSAADARFTVVSPNVHGLTEFQDLHVVVGEDWPV